MTKQCRYFLKCCKKLNEHDFTYDLKRRTIRNVHKLDGGIDIRKYIDEADTAFDCLAENGYLKRTQFGYDLTQKGLHPYQIIWDDIKSFLIKSIAVPIVVSAITSFITLCIGALL